MWEESSEQQRPLRTGFTTGTCATACTVAAGRYLLFGEMPSSVYVTLPKGKIVEIHVKIYPLSAHCIRAETIKDAGDDPDVTHGSTVFVELKKQALSGITFRAAQGVGTVTRDGLALAVGEPAINPVPRQMMQRHLQILAEQKQYKGGFELAVGIVNGEVLAQKTMNARLGILGGLSILGTTGIVRPFSCSAWIASIHQAIDVAQANHIQHIAASTGNLSEQAIKQHYDLSEMALIEMGDFIGAVLKHLKKKPIAKLSICGGFGKISKLAQGHMDLNRNASSIDLDHIAQIADRLGGDTTLTHAIQHANTSIEALKLCSAANIDLATALCEQALNVIQSRLPPSTQIEVFTINRRGEFVGHAGHIE